VKRLLPPINAQSGQQAAHGSALFFQLIERLERMIEKLTILELNAARQLLHRADMLVADARSLFFDIEDCTTVARLKNIERRLQDEVQSVERLMASEVTGEARRNAQGRALLHAGRR
jgi:hypothetical protein